MEETAGEQQLRTNRDGTSVRRGHPDAAEYTGGNGRDWRGGAIPPIHSRGLPKGTCVKETVCLSLCCVNAAKQGKRMRSYTIGRPKKSPRENHVAEKQRTPRRCARADTVTTVKKNGAPAHTVARVGASGGAAAATGALSRAAARPAAQRLAGRRLRPRAHRGRAAGVPPPSGASSTPPAGSGAKRTQPVPPPALVCTVQYRLSASANGRAWPPPAPPHRALAVGSRWGRVEAPRPTVQPRAAVACGGGARPSCRSTVEGGGEWAGGGKSGPMQSAAVRTRRLRRLPAWAAAAGAPAALAAVGHPPPAGAAAQTAPPHPSPPLPARARARWRWRRSACAALPVLIIIFFPLLRAGCGARQHVRCLARHLHWPPFPRPLSCCAWV